MAIKLGTHFNLNEFTSSSKARELKITNVPSISDIKNLERLVLNVLDPLRALYGKSIFIISGFRCEELNVAVKGSKTSQHTKGEAADIEGSDRTENLLLFNLILQNLPFDQLISEHPDEKGRPKWVHVSFSATRNRREVLTIADNGKILKQYKA